MSKHRFSTGLTYTSSRKVFHDGCAKRVIFSNQILNKNRLCLAHCALNRSFMVCQKLTQFTISTGKYPLPPPPTPQPQDITVFIQINTRGEGGILMGRKTALKANGNGRSKDILQPVSHFSAGVIVGELKDLY